MERFIAQKGVFWPQICDGKADAGAIPKLYNVSGTPDLYVVDRAGNIAARLFTAKQLDRQLAEVTVSDAFPREPSGIRGSGRLRSWNSLVLQRAVLSPMWVPAMAISRFVSPREWEHMARSSPKTSTRRP